MRGKQRCGRALVVAGIVAALFSTTSCSTTVVTCKDAREVRNATIEDAVQYTDGSFGEANGKEYASCTEFCVEFAAKFPEMERSVAECTGPTIFRPPPDENGERTPDRVGISCTFQYASCGTLNFWPPPSF